MDGGVLDNIPIARAIRAVAASPAAEPTDRWLLYLYPSPPDDVPPPPPPPHAPVRALSTVRRALTAKLGTETILDDTSALDQHNVEAAFQASRWRGLWHGAGTDEAAWPGWLAGLGEMAAVVDIRATTDAVRLRQVLEQPRRRYAGRPDVVADPGTPLRDLEAAGARRRRRARRRASSRPCGRRTPGTAPASAGDAVTVRSAIDLLIGACRAVERTPCRAWRRPSATSTPVGPRSSGPCSTASWRSWRRWPTDPPDVRGRRAVARPPPADRRRRHRRPWRSSPRALADLQPLVGALPDDPMVRPYRMLRLVDRRRAAGHGPPRRVDAGDHAAEPDTVDAEGDLRRGADAAGRGAARLPHPRRPPAAGGATASTSTTSWPATRSATSPPSSRRTGGSTTGRGGGRTPPAAWPRRCSNASTWPGRAPRPGCASSGSTSAGTRPTGSSTSCWPSSRPTGPTDRPPSAVAGRRATAAARAVAAPPPADRVGRRPQRARLAAGVARRAAGRRCAVRAARSGADRRGDAGQAADLRRRTAADHGHRRRGPSAHRHAAGQDRLRRPAAGPHVRRSRAAGRDAGPPRPGPHPPGARRWVGPCCGRCGRSCWARCSSSPRPGGPSR